MGKEEGKDGEEGGRRVFLGSMTCISVPVAPPPSCHHHSEKSPSMEVFLIQLLQTIVAHTGVLY